jgi:hypothetical protein
MPTKKDKKSAVSEVEAVVTETAQPDVVPDAPAASAQERHKSRVFIKLPHWLRRHIKADDPYS